MHTPDQRTKAAPAVASARNVRTPAAELELTIVPGPTVELPLVLGSLTVVGAAPPVELPAIASCALPIAAPAFGNELNPAETIAPPGGTVTVHVGPVFPSQAPPQLGPVAGGNTNPAAVRVTLPGLAPRVDTVIGTVSLQSEPQSIPVPRTFPEPLTDTVNVWDATGIALATMKNVAAANVFHFIPTSWWVLD